MAEIIQIDSLGSEALRPYACTSEVQLLRYFEPEPGIFIAESPKVILRALEAGYEPLSVLAEERLIRTAQGAARTQNEAGTVGAQDKAETVGAQGKAETTGERSEADMARARSKADTTRVQGEVRGETETVGAQGKAETTGEQSEAETAHAQRNAAQIRRILELVEQRGGVRVYVAGLDVLVRITGYHLTQGILCAMRRRALPSAEAVCGGASRVAVLEGVVNPTNVGAIFRSAAALNFDAVLLADGCCDPLYRRAVRVSMGTVFQIPWTILDVPAPEYVYGLKRMGFAAAAMALREDSVRIDDPGLMEQERLAVLLGSEGEGLDDRTIAASDYTVMIPMSHGVDSLNVAAASAVAFWQLTRGKG